MQTLTMQRRRARVWVTSRIIGRGVDNVDLVDRVICVLLGWRQSKRRILGAGWIKNVKVMQGSDDHPGSNSRPRLTKV
jgi:hypothetical protein